MSVTVKHECPPRPAGRSTPIPAMLRQALLNLALNACQAMPDGGTLRIACRARLARPRRDRRRGYRRRHRAGESAEDFRPLFHDQGKGQRHRALDGLPNRPAARRRGRGAVDARPRHTVQTGVSTGVDWAAAGWIGKLKLNDAAAWPSLLIALDRRSRWPARRRLRGQGRRSAGARRAAGRRRTSSIAPTSPSSSRCAELPALPSPARRGQRGRPGRRRPLREAPTPRPSRSEAGRGETRRAGRSPPPPVAPPPAARAAAAHAADRGHERRRRPSATRSTARADAPQRRRYRPAQQRSRKKAYNDAKRFLQQAEDALKAGKRGLRPGGGRRRRRRWRKSWPVAS